MITNTTNIPLPLAVWLLQDDYDYIKEDNYISATTLMKPIRHIVLPPRFEGKRDIDLTDLISSALGKTIHTSVEMAWSNKRFVRAMKAMGYPDSAIERIIVNPKPEQLTPDCIPVYIEQRAFRTIGKWKIGGKFDLVTEGIVNDVKTTSAYTWLYGGKDEDYILQGSIYRWLNPDKITEDFIRINFVFTDWQRMAARTNPNYPQTRIQHKDFKLMSLEDTEKWIVNKLNQIDKYINVPEAGLPECTDEELWRSDPQYKYYANPEKMARATKNFDSLAEANAFKAEKGGVGKVVVVKGEAKRCDYCQAYEVCTQKDRLNAT